MYVTYVAHTVRTFQSITPLTLCIETCETNYWLETTGMHATVLTVETGKWTTGIGTDTKISIGRYRYPPILVSIGQYPIPDSGIGLTLSRMSVTFCDLNPHPVTLILDSDLDFLMVYCKPSLAWPSLTHLLPCQAQDEFLLRHGRGAEYCDQFVCLSVCVCVCLSLCEHISGTAGPIFTIFCVSVPRVGVAIRYVLPVLWMMLRLAVMGRMAMCG